MNTNQAGHEQNVVNLGLMISRVNAFQAGYVPSRVDFTIPNLVGLKTSGETVINSWILAEDVQKNSISARTLVFIDFDGIVTRSINALRISGASEKTIEQAEAIVRELRSEKASGGPTKEEIAAAKAKGEELKHNVLHNSTFDSKVENFKKYVQFVGLEPAYNPNEADITITALNNKLLAIKTANENFNNTESALNVARMARNTVLYTKNTGLVDIALGVKLYVKSAFGATSPEYKSISDIQFTKLY
jgi:hypothetical protein